LTYEYNQRVFDQIFDLVFNGQGGFSYTEVYQMPVNLRSYYYLKLSNIIEARNAAQEEASEKIRNKRR
jgi:hypothetical protein